MNIYWTSLGSEYINYYYNIFLNYEFYLKKSKKSFDTENHFIIIN